MKRDSIHSRLLGAALSAVLLQGAAQATPVDFNTFVVESYPEADGVGLTPNWVILNGGRTATETVNSTATVLYSPGSIMNKHIRGTIIPGSDDDLVGLALGFNPGNATSPGADFLLLDWKRLTQSFDYTGGGGFQDLTVGANTRTLGLALSRVQGVPTNDELWALQDLPGNPGGAVTELGRGLTLGNAGYSTATGHVFDVIYQADRVQVFVDNQLQFDVAGSFNDGRLGMYELSQSPGATFTDFRIMDIGSDPVETQRFSAARIDIPAGSNGSNALSVWSVVGTGVGAHEMTIISAPNVADFEIAVNGHIPRAADGVLLTTVAQNGPRDGVFVTSQGAFNHTGWGQNRSGIATHGVQPNRGEANANLAVAYFPYADGWTGGYVNVASGTGFNNYTLASSQGVSLSDVTQLVTPSAVDQNGLYHINIPGVNSGSDGLFFVNSATNEGNYASATPHANGGWRVGVRDNFLAANTTPDNFEHDSFGFLYMPINTPLLVGAHVTGFDGDGKAITALTSGNYSLLRQDVGQYLLTIERESPETGILLLTGSSPYLLADGELAPLNHYLTYEAMGNSFLLNLLVIEGGVGASLTDGQFYFAFVPFDATIPEPATASLLALGGVLAMGRRRRQA